MKQTLILVLSLAFLNGCLGGSRSTTGDADYPSRWNDTTFAEQYRRLEQQPVPDATQKDADSKKLQSSDERAADVAAKAQAERRGEPPLIESNYFFKVQHDKGVYSFNKYNEVWKDEPEAKDYKGSKRLWEKPKKYAATSYYGASSYSGDSDYNED